MILLHEKFDNFKKSVVEFSQLFFILTVNKYLKLKNKKDSTTPL